MLSRTHLGMLRTRELGMSGREFVAFLHERGCPEMTLRRLRGIEIGELRATGSERKAIADALGVRTWEAFK